MTSILHVLTSPRAEGTPRLVLDWLAADVPHHQAVMTLHSAPPDLTDELKAAAQEYHEFQLLDRGRSKFPAITSTVHRVVQRLRPEVLVCWPTGFSNWVCAGARSAGCKRLLVHAGNPASRGMKANWLSRYVMWPLATMGARVVCCSDYVRDSIRRIPGIPDRLTVTVYNCAPAASMSQRAEAARSVRSDRRPTAIMVATLERHKDHETLLRAIPAVAQEYPDFQMVLAGDGSQRTKLCQLSRTLQIQDQVQFLGMRGDIPELLGGADLFVFATTPQEGLGIVLLEALAAGLPVVASRVPACAELLQDGRWGSLVAPGDSSALAAEILRSLESREDESQRRAAMQYAASFTSERMIAEYLRIAGIESGAAVEPSNWRPT